jgi:hypothetical protein
MLDALLATIGTLGILLTLALKFGKAGADAMQREAERQDDPAGAARKTPAGRRPCPHRRSRRRLLKGTGR